MTCLWSRWSFLILTLLPFRVSAFSWFLSRSRWIDDWTKVAQPLTMSASSLPVSVIPFVVMIFVFWVFKCSPPCLISITMSFGPRSDSGFCFFVFCATRHNIRWKKNWFLPSIIFPVCDHDLTLVLLKFLFLSTAADTQIVWLDIYPPLWFS